MKAFKFAQKALSMDESDAYSHAILGYIYALMRKYEKAILSGKRSVELQPNGATAIMYLGSTLGYTGNFDEALPILGRQFVSTLSLPTTIIIIWAGAIC